MNEGVTIECDFHFGKLAKGRKTFVAGTEPECRRGGCQR